MSTTALAPTDLQFLAIPVASLHASPLNPRKRMTGIEELADSIRSVGILEPLVVRPIPYGVYEVVAGGRRLEAARMAGLDTVPCTVRPLTDEQALELAIIENNQRGDIHPLEEADAFQRLRELDPGHTPGSIAAKIGRPVAYVVSRLKLLALAPEAREAFSNDDITIGHAHLLAGLTPEQQAKALGSCFEYSLDFDRYGYDQDDEDAAPREAPKVTAPVRRLREYIREHVALDLASAEVQAEFPQLAQATTAAAAAGATVVMLNDNWGPRPGTQGVPLDAPLPRACWWEVHEDEPGAQRGVFVMGRRQGRVIWVKLRPAQEPRTRQTSSAPTKEEKAAAKKRKQEEQERHEAARLAQARRQTVEIEAVRQLVLKTAGPENPWGAPQVRVLLEVLVGGDTFDAPVLEAAAEALKVPVSVFKQSGSKDRLKLNAPKLAQVMAVLAVGAETSYQFHDPKAIAEVFETFGVDYAAIDKAVAKEQAAATKPPARKKAR